MSDYAVVNPATGEKVKEYPQISDDELDAAIGKAVHGLYDQAVAAGYGEKFIPALIDALRARQRNRS